jgi:hypothetical protein
MSPPQPFSRKRGQTRSPGTAKSDQISGKKGLDRDGKGDLREEFSQELGRHPEPAWSSRLEKEKEAYAFCTGKHIASAIESNCVDVVHHRIQLR